MSRIYLKNKIKIIQNCNFVRNLRSIKTTQILGYPLQEKNYVQYASPNLKHMCQDQT